MDNMINDIQQASPTILDGGERTLKYIVDNKLDHIWTMWSNPVVEPGKEKSVRFNAYTPIYTDGAVGRIKKYKCNREISGVNGRVPCPGTWEVPFEDRARRVLFRIKCSNPSCGGEDNIFRRWVSSIDQTKLHFKSPEYVQHYGTLGRAFYATLITYRDEACGPERNYGNEALISSATLGIDIDIKRAGTIIDSNNRENLQKAIDIILEQIDTVAPGSFNLQCSGNGAYVLGHHRLCTQNVLDTMARFNNYIELTLKPLVEKEVKGIQVDSLNGASRVFKMVFSPHQQFDIAAIPLEYDVDLTKMDAEKFKLKNFNVKDYINDNRVLYYNRSDNNDIKELYTVLNETSEKHPNYSSRAKRYVTKEGIAALTDEIGHDEEGSESDIKQKDITDEDVQHKESETEWEDFDTKTPGMAQYRKTINKKGKTVYMLRVKDENPDRIYQEFKKKVDSKEIENIENIKEV